MAYSLLETKIRGCHSEMFTINEEQFEEIQQLCQHQAERLAENQSKIPNNYDFWLEFQEHFRQGAYEYLLREQLVDASLNYCFGNLVEKLEIDPLTNIELDAEGNLSNASKFTYILTDIPKVKIQVYVCDRQSFNSLKKDKVRWCVTTDDLKNHQVLLFMCLLGFPDTRTTAEIPIIFTGFIPTNQVTFTGPKTYLKLTDLLYIGGIGCYLASFQKANTPITESFLISENIKISNDDNSLYQEVVGWKLAYTLTGHNNAINSLAINLTGQILASGSRGVICLWDLTDGQLISTLSEYPWVKNWEIDEINSLVFSPEDHTLISGGTDTTLKIWHPGAQDLIDILEQHNGIVRCLSFSANGQILASGGDDRKIHLWNRRQREASGIISWGDGVPHSLTFSQDGLFLASGSYRKIKIWYLQDETGSESPHAKLLHTLTAHSHIVTGLLFCPDNQTLISSSRDGTIKLWHWKTGKLIRTIKEDIGAIYAIALDPKEEIIASGSEDNTLRLWHLSSGKLLGIFTGHTQPVNAVAFTPDGQTLVSASQDKTIKVWQRS
ncbi:WD40 repeat domain-containing protein [Phormidium sp. LEGE 05292]|uniref:WD40 repeat domain-containing protein n=1 Tax=[Phormidium] sp. LEGE 05292 TaxID=767427 RepID=UPI001882FCEE|nr:WD40 repeat domain-containing protein [Phormidium sp. LEGE 05292]MBE9229287.1 WD40 repeat domain-containing protein [Phormidium sp. LEGE 05292]